MIFIKPSTLPTSANRPDMNMMKLSSIIYSGFAALVFTHVALGQMQLNTVCTLPQAVPSAFIDVFDDGQCGVNGREYHVAQTDNSLQRTTFQSIGFTSFPDPACQLLLFRQDDLVGVPDGSLPLPLSVIGSVDVGTCIFLNGPDGLGVTGGGFIVQCPESQGQLGFRARSPSTYA